MKAAGWKMHDKGLASFFFGIRICQSDDGISIDQAPCATEVVASVLGKDWSTRLKTGLKHSIPLPAGSEHEAALLVNKTPFDALSSVQTASQLGDGSDWNQRNMSEFCSNFFSGFRRYSNLFPTAMALIG
jgi:hypothetical protein